MAIPKVTTHAGVDVPCIIYGTAWKAERTAGLVEAALLAGFVGIDTACQPKHYHESGVGEGLSRVQSQGINPAEIFMQTKFTPLRGHDPKRIPYDARASLSTQVEQSFVCSETHLGAGTIDSLVLHSPLPSHHETLTVWRAMENIHQAKRVGQLGLSNCYDVDFFQWLLKTSSVKPAVLQNRFYRETGYDKQLRRICLDEGIAYQSFWTLSANRELLTNKALVKVSVDHGKTVAQVLFRWLTQMGACPLTGTTSSIHMRQALDIFDFELDTGELKVIENLL